MQQVPVGNNAIRALKHNLLCLRVRARQIVMMLAAQFCENYASSVVLLNLVAWTLGTAGIVDGKSL
jgi:hypothetical protein